MTNDELEAVRARAAKATPGPWEADHGCAKGYGPAAWATVVAPDGKVLFDTINGGHVLLTDPDYEGEWRDETGDLNATFIAHARTDIPALLDEVERRRGESAKEAEAREAMLGVTHRQMTDVIELRARATRAEAHAERLAGALEDAVASMCRDQCRGYHRLAYGAAQKALAAYRGVKDEACSRPSDALDAPVQPTSSHLENGADQ